MTASSTRAWLARAATDTYCIDPSSPWENGYVESLETRRRGELLDREIFHALQETQVLTAQYRQTDSRTTSIEWMVSCSPPP